MRRTHREPLEHSRVDDEDGFTLMELLIVIVILGVLAGIAFLAIEPFQKAAVESCFDLEFMSMEVVEGAQRAGIDVSQSDSPECIPIALEFANAVENPNSVVTLQQQPQPGRTMVAISGHRAGTVGAPVICSGSQFQADGSCTSTTSGWQLHGVFNAGLGSTTTGRGIAVWTKLVGPDEPTLIRAAWGTTNPSAVSKSLIVGVFNRQLTFSGIQTANSGGSLVTNLDLGSAGGGAGPAVVIGALASRASSGGTGPCGSSVTSAPYTCVVFSGVPSIKKAAEQGSSVYTGMSWTAVRNGAGPYQASVQWSNPHLAIGFTMVLNLFSP